MGSSGALLKVDWMTPVQILTMRDGARVSRPECSSVIFVDESEGIRVLSKTVQVRVRREPCLQFEELPLEDEAGVSSVEEDFAGMLPDDLKCEWLPVLGESKGEQAV